MLKILCSRLAVKVIGQMTLPGSLCSPPPPSHPPPSAPRPSTAAFCASASPSFGFVFSFSLRLVLESMQMSPSPSPWSTPCHALPPYPPAPSLATAATMINIVLNDKQAKMCQGNNKPAKLIAFNRKARAKMPNKGWDKGTRGGLRQVKSKERSELLGQPVEYSCAGNRPRLSWILLTFRNVYICI